MNVTLYQRRPQKDNYSIERLFDDIRKSFLSGVHCRVAVSKFPSRGFFRRLYNIIEAVFHQGDVNHVTGDIHFITYFLCKKKTILTIHDCVMLERLHGFRRFILWLLWYWLPEKRCKIITVVSHSTKNQILDYLNCNESKVKVIHNNVSEDFFYKKKAFNSIRPRILQIGTGENKNINRVIQAISGMDCCFVVIGTLNKYQQDALSKYSVEYENYSDISRQDILEQYHLCDMVIFASTYEGFGLPIVEANAVGRPVITSNCWSMPEVAGNAACLVDPYNVEEIRDAVLRIIDDWSYRANLIRLGLENVKRFRVGHIAEQYAELYREVALGCDFKRF
ncbi:MAG: glycosyltransferase family 1 protein [Bacteroidota bacterium]